MSGIVGIFNLDNAPVELGLLSGLTEYLTYRGPDGWDCRQIGPVGLGFTRLLAGGYRDARLQPLQPLRLDGEAGGSLWIVADARLDGRTDLLSRLGLSSNGVGLSDAELIGWAYRRWGEDCGRYLLGDWSFALWDERRQRLFCARDPLGVKLFYYARFGQTFLFSNTLACLQRHPLVSDRLNESVIADFLLFETNQQPDQTAFAAIKALPGGHFLSVLPDAATALQPIRYWQLPVPVQLRYRRDQEYIEHFQTVLGQAVADRLPANGPTALFLSGGLDSSGLAATAQTVRPAADLHGFTQVYERLMPVQERFYTELVARQLNINMHWLLADDYQLFDGSDRPEVAMPGPYNLAHLQLWLDRLDAVLSQSRVVLYGEGPDEALKGSSLAATLRCMPPWSALADFYRCVTGHRLRPTLGTGLGRLTGSRRRPYVPPYPQWVEADFAARWDLPTRWQTRWQRYYAPLPVHLVRPLAYARLTDPVWPSIFETIDPGVTRRPLEIRLPYLDLRVLDFMLSLPPLPWCVNKELLRVAWRGKLPPEVLSRPKTPLGDSLKPLLKAASASRLWQVSSDVGQVEAFVDVAAFNGLSSNDGYSSRQLMLPRSLALWLQAVNSLDVRSNVDAKTP